MTSLATSPGTACSFFEADELRLAASPIVPSPPIAEKLDAKDEALRAGAGFVVEGAEDTGLLILPPVRFRKAPSKVLVEVDFSGVLGPSREEGDISPSGRSVYKGQFAVGCSDGRTTGTKGEETGGEVISGLYAAATK